MRKPMETTVAIDISRSTLDPNILAENLKAAFIEARVQVLLWQSPGRFDLHFFTTDLSDVCEILNDHELL